MTHYYISRSETTKLFYDQYLYKLIVTNPIVSIFREKNLTFAREQLDKLQLEYELNSSLLFSSYLRTIKLSEAEFTAAKILLAEFSMHKNYKLRVESPKVAIYSNNKVWIDTLLGKPLAITEFCEPNKSNIKLLVKNNIVINDKNFKYNYKITLKDKVNEQFYNWLVTNPNKVKIGDVCLESIKRGNYVRGFYFYLKGEQTLSIVNLMIGAEIARIDNIVYKAVKDK